MIEAFKPILEYKFAGIDIKLKCKPSNFSHTLIKKYQILRCYTLDSHICEVVALWLLMERGRVWLVMESHVLHECNVNFQLVSVSHFRRAVAVAWKLHYSLYCLWTWITGFFKLMYLITEWKTFPVCGWICSILDTDVSISKQINGHKLTRYQHLPKLEIIMSSGCQQNGSLIDWPNTFLYAS